MDFPLEKAYDFYTWILLIYFSYFCIYIVAFAEHIIIEKNIPSSLDINLFRRIYSISLFSHGKLKKIEEYESDTKLLGKENDKEIFF